MHRFFAIACTAFASFAACGSQRPASVPDDAGLTADERSTLPPTPDQGPAPPADAASARPISVILENATAGPLYIDGLSAPFFVRDAASVAIAPVVPFGSFDCTRCAEQCQDNPLHGDPAPCYVEIAAGASLTLAWDGALHDGRAPCAQCTKKCHAPSGRLPAGEHVFEVPYRTALDDAAYTFREAQCAYLPLHQAHSGRQWLGDSLGVPQFDQQAELTVAFDGGDELRLRIAPR